MTPEKPRHDDLHFHVCERCAHVFAHECGAHGCPKCGSGPWLTAIQTRREAEEARIELKKGSANG